MIYKTNVIVPQKPFIFKNEMKFRSTALPVFPMPDKKNSKSATFFQKNHLLLGLP